VSTQEHIRLSIESLALGGDGIARHPDGRVVFIPFVAAGDQVLVEIIESKTKFCRGKVVEVIAPGPDREEPQCNYYGRCGGCQYQHLNYQAELAAKQQQVQDSLRRIGKLDNVKVKPMIASPLPYGYRNRITVHRLNRKIGFRGVDSNTFIPIKECKIANDVINQQLSEPGLNFGQDRRVTLRSEEVEGTGFFQANTLLLDQFRTLVHQALPSNGETLLEGYGGVGWLTKKLAARYEKILSVESDGRAVAAGQKEIPSGFELIHGPCEEEIPRLVRLYGQHIDAVLMDPPRDGLAKEVTESLAHIKQGKFVYVSCNPATLARDLSRLSQDWKVEWVQPIDMFPRTAHIECISLCSPTSGGSTDQTH